MNLTDYKVKTITYPYGEYRLGAMVPIIDEGSFYRIDGTHIFDKFKIISTSLDGDTGTAGRYQVEGVKNGMMLNIGGSATTNYVFIVGAE